MSLVCINGRPSVVCVLHGCGLRQHMSVRHLRAGRLLSTSLHQSASAGRLRAGRLHGCGLRQGVSIIRHMLVVCLAVAYIRVHLPVVCMLVICLAVLRVSMHPSAVCVSVVCLTVVCPSACWLSAYRSSA
jgi:hypothetical protein